MNSPIKSTTGTMVEVMSFPRQVIGFLFACVAFVIHNLGPSTSQEILQQRKKTCDECKLTDLQGNRLFRKNEDGTPFCGRPLMEKKIRDPKVEGCGCFLNLKWKKVWTGCPNKLW